MTLQLAVLFLYRPVGQEHSVALTLPDHSLDCIREKTRRILAFQFAGLL
jgi:hypothetical protein